MSLLKIANYPAHAAQIKSFARSAWFFPALMSAALIIATVLQIHGSSIGVYHTLYLYGETPDSDLILNEPRPIRSDEWLVNSQLTIAQANNNYERINDNLGNGEDMSLLVDVPYKDWSVLFKPHNLAFFVMPFDNAFAFRWWFMAYLLILGAYFFVLALLPRKRLLASLLAVGFFFSPFVQWWYLFGTLGALYYAFFAVFAGLKLVEEKRLKQSLAWGLLLAYTLACFALLLYPPFQIPVAIVAAAVMAGLLVEKIKLPKKELLKKFAIILGSLLIAGSIASAYLLTRQGPINTIQNTAYPGQRAVTSGGFDLAHISSGHLAYQFQFTGKAAKYRLVEGGGVSPTNQSEASNFMPLLPLLLLPSLFLLWKGYRTGRGLDWPLLAAVLTFGLLLVRVSTPYLNSFFELLLVDRVPHKRLIIGLGLLGMFHAVLLIKNLSGYKASPIKKHASLIYALVVFAAQVMLGIYAMERSPGFIGIYKVIALSVPLAVVVYLLLVRKFVLAAAGLLAFSVYSSVGVNPLYRGTEVITETPVSKAIRKWGEAEKGKWADDSLVYENFPLLNGVPTLSGVYTYPQLSLWEPLDSGGQSDIYNRYAHAGFVLDRDPNTVVPASLRLIGGDHFRVSLEPCDAFLKDNDVRFLLTTGRLNGQDSCARLVETIPYPKVTFYIYRLVY